MEINLFWPLNIQNQHHCFVNDNDEVFQRVHVTIMKMRKHTWWCEIYRCAAKVRNTRLCTDKCSNKHMWLTDEEVMLTELTQKAMVFKHSIPTAKARHGQQTSNSPHYLIVTSCWKFCVYFVNHLALCDDNSSVQNCFCNVVAKTNTILILQSPKKMLCTHINTSYRSLVQTGIAICLSVCLESLHHKAFCVWRTNSMRTI